MDKYIAKSIDNCLKEISALKELVRLGKITKEEMVDCLDEICWNINNIYKRKVYVSDEFQFRLKKLKEIKTTTIDKTELYHVSKESTDVSEE